MTKPRRGEPGRIYGAALRSVMVALHVVAVSGTALAANTDDPKGGRAPSGEAAERLRARLDELLGSGTPPGSGSAGSDAAPPEVRPQTEPMAGTGRDGEIEEFSPPPSTKVDITVPCQAPDGTRGHSAQPDADVELRDQLATFAAPPLLPCGMVASVASILSASNRPGGAEDVVTAATHLLRDIRPLPPATQAEIAIRLSLAAGAQGRTDLAGLLGPLARPGKQGDARREYLETQITHGNGLTRTCTVLSRLASSPNLVGHLASVDLARCILAARESDPALVGSTDPDAASLPELADRLGAVSLIHRGTPLGREAASQEIALVEAAGGTAEAVYRLSLALSRDRIGADEAGRIAGALTKRRDTADDGALRLAVRRLRRPTDFEALTASPKATTLLSDRLAETGVTIDGTRTERVLAGDAGTSDWRATISEEASARSRPAMAPPEPDSAVRRRMSASRASARLDPNDSDRPSRAVAGNPTTDPNLPDELLVRIDRLLEETDREIREVEDMAR